MKNISLFLILFVQLSISVYSQEKYPVISVTKDIEVTKLSDHTYIHTSYADMPPFGRVSSNGLIFVNREKAFLFDTPVNDKLTEDLIKWIEGKLKAEILGVTPNHWHIDCMGGMKYIQLKKIPSFAYELTRKIAEEKNLPVPSRGFADSMVFRLGKEKMVCKFFGPAHSMDNITVWIPSEKVLFPGCMVRSAESTSLGNTADTDTVEWPKTIQKITDAYPDVIIVVPGHGHYGGIELLQHTMELLKNSKPSELQDRNNISK